MSYEERKRREAERKGAEAAINEKIAGLEKIYDEIQKDLEQYNHDYCADNDYDQNVNEFIRIRRPFKRFNKRLFSLLQRLNEPEEDNYHRDPSSHRKMVQVHIARLKESTDKADVELLKLLRKYLQEKGYSDIVESSYEWYKKLQESPLEQAIRLAEEENISFRKAAIRIEKLTGCKAGTLQNQYTKQRKIEEECWKIQEEERDYEYEREYEKEHRKNNPD